MIILSLIRYSWYFYSLYLVIKNKDNNNDTNTKNILRLQKAIYDCGPMGVKLIQFLIMYDNFMPKETTEMLQFTLEDCKQHSWNETKNIYFKNFNKNISDDFKIETEEPCVIGSGSIGQVYKLYNYNLQKYVAIKVRHPNIDSEIKEFVLTVDVIIKILSIFIQIPYLTIIDLFKNNIAIQNDFIIEANNTNKYAENFKNDRNIIIPEVYYYSTDIIVMSYHNGVSVNTISDKQKRYAISNDINFIILSSIMIYDFLHSDLHNGNWKIELLEDGSYNIIIYDCGLMTSTNQLDINQEIFMSIMIADYKRYCKIIDKIYIPKINEPPQIKINKLEKLNNLMKKLIEDDVYNSIDRFTLLIKFSIDNDIVRDKKLINLLISIIMTSTIHVLGVERNQKVFGMSPTKIDIALVFNTYIGLLDRMNKYEKFKLFILEYINSNPNNTTVFINWLKKELGHEDKDVFFDIIAKMNGLDNNYKSLV